MIECDRDGVLPVGFYSTTNLGIEMRVNGKWKPVTHSEMDCAIVVDENGARMTPMHRVRQGELVVIGHHGMRVLRRRRCSAAICSSS